MDNKLPTECPDKITPTVNNTLTAGVSPDGLKDSYGIKILICYLIYLFKDSLTPKDILEISFERAIANYFEVCSVMEELISDKLILKDAQTELLSLSADGQLIAESLYADTPFTVREKAINAVKKRLARRRHEQETNVEITEVSDGCQVTCTLLGNETAMMSISLYVPDKKYALTARERFIDDPEYIYRFVLSHLTNESLIAPESEKTDQQ